MRYLTDKEAERFLKKAAEIAKRASCERSKCGAIIVKDNKIIGKGFNSPPNNLESQRRCLNKKEKYSKKVTDKTCCVHAEQRAMMDALRNHPDKLKDSRLYFIRLDADEIISKSGKPYCTICSKMALDVGIKEFVIWYKEGIACYSTEEYNNLSFGFN